MTGDLWTIAEVLPGEKLAPALWLTSNGNYHSPLSLSQRECERTMRNHLLCDDEQSWNGSEYRIVRRSELSVTQITADLHPMLKIEAPRPQ